MSVEEPRPEQSHVVRFCLQYFRGGMASCNRAGFDLGRPFGEVRMRDTNGNDCHGRDRLIAAARVTAQSARPQR